MSVRRLAEDAVQPADFAFNGENAAWAEKRIALYPAGRQQSAVIPLLMRAQEQEGWVSRAAIERIGEMLSMPYIRVLEVATFYTQFQLQPVGTRAHVQVCGTTPCMLRGAEDLRAVCQRKIHHDPHHLNADGTLSWEEVECAGACVNAPMVTIFQDTYEDLTPERLEEIIDAFAEGRGDEITPGPQVARQFAAPASGFTSLTDVPEVSAKGGKAKVPAAPQAPTTAGQPGDVSVEAAPAIKGPSPVAKVSRAKADAERQAAAAEAEADGEPNRAMREDAVGAEAKGGKRDAGRAPGKTPAEPSPPAGAPEVNPQAEIGGGAPLFVAPEGVPDDLKLISGVGPVLEAKLNALGVTRFEQIAKFKKADIARVDAVLNFKGRIERDEWVKQAKALAKGGAAEYRRQFGKEPR